MEIWLYRKGFWNFTSWLSRAHEILFPSTSERQRLGLWSPMYTWQSWVMKHWITSFNWNEIFGTLWRWIVRVFYWLKTLACFFQSWSENTEGEPLLPLMVHSRRYSLNYLPSASRHLGSFCYSQQLLSIQHTFHEVTNCSASHFSNYFSLNNKEWQL